MRADIIHITDHAFQRWIERVSDTGFASLNEIVEAVKRSRVIKKHELLPYGMPRLDGSVYTANNGVLFILKSLSIYEYNLVTVIGKNSQQNLLMCKTTKKIKDKHIKNEKCDELIHKILKELQAVRKENKKIKRMLEESLKNNQGN